MYKITRVWYKPTSVKAQGDWTVLTTKDYGQAREALVQRVDDAMEMGYHVELHSLRNRNASATITTHINEQVTYSLTSSEENPDD